MKTEMKMDLAWGGGIIVVALAATLAQSSDLISSDTSTRIVLGLTGLMVAAYGNRLPKTLVPNAGMRRANRVAGWSMALSGLIYAGLWAIAPMPVALIGGCGAIIAGIAVTLAYCRSLRSKTV